MESRKELYAAIKAAKLEKKVCEQYGKNYTNCSSSQLKGILDKYTKVSTKENIKCKNIYNEKLDKLIELLAKKHILLASEVSQLK